MVDSIGLAVILCIVVISVTGCVDDVNNTIFQGPKDITIFEGQTATFTCMIEAYDGIVAGWDINGRDHGQLTHEAIYTPQLSRNSTREYTYGEFLFYLPARAYLNNSRIQCKYMPFFMPVWIFTCSDTANLTIQGPPEAVTDLRIAENVSHVVATWEAPFTLDVTGVEYDVTYSLLISNITDDTQPTPVDCAVCRNLTLPQYVFSPPNPLPGHTFTFIVTPQNGAGTGPPSLPVTVTLANNDTDDHGISSTISQTLSTSSTPTSQVLFSTGASPKMTSSAMELPLSTLHPKPSSNEDINIPPGIVYGGSAVILLLLMLTIASCIGCCCQTRCRQQKIIESPVHDLTDQKSTISMQQNPVYNLTEQRESSISMQQNPVYDLTEQRESSISMQQNPVYNLTEQKESSISMQQNPVYGTNDVITMQHNPVYRSYGPIQTDRNMAYETIHVHDP